jgi:MFS family permease
MKAPGSTRGSQLLLLAVALSAANYARTALGPLQERVRLALALSDNQIALLQGPAMALPLVIAALPLGLLIDRSSRARLIFIFAFLSLLGSVATALASNFAMLFAARCLVGLAASATSVAVLSLLSDLYAPAQRGRATMAVAVGEVAGASAAFALGGALLALFVTTLNGWQSAMFWLSVPLALVMFLMVAMREPPRRGVAIQRPSARQACVELWRYRAVVTPLVTAKIMAVTAYGAVVIWTAPTLSRNFGLSPDRIGAIMATSLLVSGILGPIAGGIVADLCQRSGGPRRTMIALCILAVLSVPTGCFPLMPGVLSMSALLILFMTIINMIGVTEMTLTTVVIPNELRGLSLSVLVATGLVFGVGLAPLTVSLLSGVIGGPAMIGTALALICVLAGIVGAAIFAFGRRYIPSIAVP